MSVEVRSGRVVVESKPDLELVLLLEQMRWQLLHRGRVIAALDGLIDDLHQALALAKVADPGNIACPLVDEPSSSNFVKVSTASRASGIPVRTLRYRCRAGHYPGARLVDGQWFIPLKEIA